MADALLDVEGPRGDGEDTALYISVGLAAVTLRVSVVDLADPGA